jgi:hypothetical protein
MTNRDLGKSIVRTIVPVIVGLIIAGLARIGLDLAPDQIGVWLDGLVVSGYYAVLRLLESKVPAFGWLLGLPAPPSYDGDE